MYNKSVNLTPGGAGYPSVRISRSVMEVKVAKYGFWGVVIAAAISGSVALVIHLSEKHEKEQIRKAQKEAQERVEEEKRKGLAFITIDDVEMPSVNTKIDSSFLLRLSNKSYSDAKNVITTINFGEATVNRCEVFPIDVLDGKKFDTSAVVVEFDNIKKGGEVYIYCLISNPIFKDIRVSGDNLKEISAYSIVNYRFKDKVELEEEGSGFYTFFKFVGAIVAVIFIGYFTIVVLSLLNKKFKID